MEIHPLEQILEDKETLRQLESYGLKREIINGDTLKVSDSNLELRFKNDVSRGIYIISFRINIPAEIRMRTDSMADWRLNTKGDISFSVQKYEEALKNFIAIAKQYNAYKLRA